nr:fimbria/pilus outer membrane usher protein [Limnobaculum xujianqingii]
MDYLTKYVYWFRQHSLLLSMMTGMAYTHASYADTPQVDVNDDEYSFDESLLKGSNLAIPDISRFNKVESIIPGQYQVDIYLNNVFVGSNNVTFVSSDSNKVLPCFSRELLIKTGVRESAIDKNTQNITHENDCIILEQQIDGASSHFQFTELRLNLSIPQKLMNHRPRGYISSDSLSSGETIGFVNYSLNQYHVAYKNSASSDLDSTYANINAGANLGLWRYRQQSFYSNQTGQESRFTTTRRYVQRAIAPLGSEMMLGEGFTSGRYFSGLGYRGLELASDDRMLPESQRGYAPSVHGIAKTNANVVIRQGENIIYQSTVAPGPFEISDLNATNYAGDLDVSVTEADGSVSTFRVPFSAVSESLRPNISRYSLVVGKTRYVGDSDLFGEASYRRGISNAITANSAFRLADGYQATMLGGVYTSQLGAFGLDATYSRAQLPNSNDQSGWMFHLSYSKTYSPTNTTLSIGGYQYSTNGYRELNDVLGVRQAEKSGDDWQSSTYMQKTRLEGSINQSLDWAGNIYLSASTQNYRGGKARDKQLQLGYSKVFQNGVSLNLSVARTHNGGYYNNPYNNNEGYSQNDNNSASETNTAFSISIPLGQSSYAPILTGTLNRSGNSGTAYQTSLSGTMGEKRDISYGVNVSTDSRQHQTVWNGNLQTRSSVATLGASASTASDYWQASGSVQGAMALHSGGITLGPYVGDTFALVEAKGAKGASVMGGQGAKIDTFGYALVPALTPYRYNTIALDPEGMDSRSELQDAQKRIAPYAGATVKVNFKTLSGYALLITVQRPEGSEPIPMGADVYDQQDKVIGMVGQGNQAYLRSNDIDGYLSVRWGTQPDQQCRLHYDLSEHDTDKPLIVLTGQCQ